MPCQTLTSKSRICFPDRRRFRQLRHRPHRDAGKSADLAFPDLTERGRKGDDRGVGFVLQQRRQHLRAGTIDDVDLVDAGLAVEIGHEQMRPVAQARRGVVELARLLFRRGNEFGQRRVGQRRPDQHHRRQVGRMDDRREGGVRVVGQLGERVRHRVGPDLGEEQRVAVRLLARHRGRGDGAAGAGPVLHDQRLAVGELRKAVRQVARQRIGRAARADRHQQPDRAVGPLRRRLGKGRDGGERGGHNGGDTDDGTARKAGEVHDNSPRCQRRFFDRLTRA